MPTPRQPRRPEHRVPSCSCTRRPARCRVPPGQREVFRVVALVRAQRRRLDSQTPFHPVEHPQAALAFGVAVGLPHADVHADAVAILHEHVHAVLQVRHAGGLGVQPRLRINDAAMRLVAASFPAEVDPGVADLPAGVVRVVVSLLRGGLLPLDPLQALESRVALQQRTVDREVVFAQEPRVHGHHHDAIAELLGDVESIEPFPVDAQDAVVEAWLVGIHVEEPSEENVERDPFTQGSLGPHGVEAHEHHGLQQALGRDAGATALLGRGVRRGERPSHGRKRLVGHSLDRPQRVIRRDQFLQVELHEQVGLTVGASSHTPIFALRRPPVAHRWAGLEGFSTPCQNAPPIAQSLRPISPRLASTNDYGVRDRGFGY